MIDTITNESKLFDFLKTHFIEDLESSEEEFSVYDCFSQKLNWDIELKCRHKHYDDLLIERSKYERLLFRSIKFSTDPIYINSTPKGIYLFDLSLCTLPAWEDRMMPKTSEFQDRQFISKSVGYLNINTSKRLL